MITIFSMEILASFARVKVVNYVEKAWFKINGAGYRVRHLYYYEFHYLPYLNYFGQLKYIIMISKQSLFFCLFLFAFLFGPEQVNSQDKNWTHFRGSNLNAIAETENIPLKWDDSVIKWKTAIHDRGFSSPVVYNDQIWVTTATDNGKELYAVCIDFQTGKIIYDIKVFTPDDVPGKHSLNTYATPTPCIEKGFVYVHYGSMGTACIDTDTGLVVWKQTDFECKHIQGPASSPVIYKNLLILHFEGTDVRYIVALDKTNGKLIWKTDRPAEPYEKLTWIAKKAYVTPLLINVKGRDMLISNGSAVCQALDPDTGKEIWRVVNGGESTIAMPFTENGVLYCYAGPIITGEGFTYTDLMAVNPDAAGDVTATKVIWKKEDRQSQNQMLTPVIKDGLIYTVTTRNTLMCIDAATGEEIWSERVKSNFNASPLFINGSIWLFSVKGEVMVIKAGRAYELIAQNLLDSGIWATPAVLRNSMIIRTEEYLYRMGE
jgi:outer membrane protein assembly factor BamB